MKLCYTIKVFTTEHEISDTGEMFCVVGKSTLGCGLMPCSLYYWHLAVCVFLPCSVACVYAQVFYFTFPDPVFETFFLGVFCIAFFSDPVFDTFCLCFSTVVFSDISVLFFFQILYFIPPLLSVQPMVFFFCVTQSIVRTFVFWEPVSCLLSWLLSAVIWQLNCFLL